MPVQQQNALVNKYCAVCHTDRARNGGLSLEHYDASSAPPSLKAMLVSKLTGGAALSVARAADSDSSAIASVTMKMKSGAMGAAGLPIPDQSTILSLIVSLAAESTGAEQWSVRQSAAPAGQNSIVNASIVREIPAAGRAGDASIYRLVVECDRATRQGEMQLSWSPSPTTGTLHVSIDGGQPLSYAVEGREFMGNGSSVTTGPAAIMLTRASVTLPRQTLRISNLFPQQQTEFSFRSPDSPTREALSACFPDKD